MGRGLVALSSGCTGTQICVHVNRMRRNLEASDAGCDIGPALFGTASHTKANTDMRCWRWGTGVEARFRPATRIAYEARAHPTNCVSPELLHGHIAHSARLRTVSRAPRDTTTDRCGVRVTKHESSVSLV